MLDVSLRRKKISGPYDEVKKHEMPRAKQVPSLPTVAKYVPSGEKEIALIEP